MANGEQLKSNGDIGNEVPRWKRLAVGVALATLAFTGCSSSSETPDAPTTAGQTAEQIGDNTDPTEQTQEALQKTDTVSEYSKEDQEAIKQLEKMSMDDLEKKIGWTLKEAQEYFKDPTNTVTVNDLAEVFHMDSTNVIDLNAITIHNLLGEDPDRVEQQVNGILLTPSNIIDLIKNAEDPYMTIPQEEIPGHKEEYIKYVDGAALGAKSAFDTLVSNGRLNPLDTSPMEEGVNPEAAGLSGLVDKGHTRYVDGKQVGPKNLVIYKLGGDGVVTISKGYSDDDIAYLKGLPGFGEVSDPRSTYINNFYISGPVGFAAGDAWPWSVAILEEK